MADRLFGTDGVRGRAGTPPLDPRTVRRLGRRARARAAHGPPTSTGCSSAATRASREAGSPGSCRTARTPRAAGWRAPASSRRPRSPTSRAKATTMPASSSPPRTIPSRTTASRCSPARGEKFTERLERGDRDGRRRSGVAGARRATPAPCPTGTCRAAYLAHARAALPGRGAAPRAEAGRRLRQRRDQRCSRRVCWPGWASTWSPRLLARRPQHQPGLRVDASRGAWRARWSRPAAGSASRSTAMATARSSPTNAGGSSTATRSCCWLPATWTPRAG